MMGGLGRGKGTGREVGRVVRGEEKGLVSDVDNLATGAARFLSVTPRVLSREDQGPGQHAQLHLSLRVLQDRPRDSTETNPSKQREISVHGHLLNAANGPAAKQSLGKLCKR